MTKSTGDRANNNTNIGGIPDNENLHDRGWAWVVAFAAMANQFIGVGMYRVSGIVVVELMDVYDVPASKGAFYYLCAALGFATTALLYMCGLGEYFHERGLVAVSAFLACLGYIITYFSTRIEHVFVQAFLSGAASQIGIASGLQIVGWYFMRRRAIANSIVMTGASLGVLAMPPITQWLLDEYSYRGTALISAGVVLNSLVCGALMRPFRVPCKPKTTAVDHNIQRTALNHNDKETIGKRKIQRPMSNHNDQETIGTHNVQGPISNHNDQETIGTHNVQRPISNHNDQETIGTHNVQRPISNHNDQETIGTHNVQRPIYNHNDQETIGKRKTQRPMSNHNDQEAIGTHNVQRPISNHNDQEAIGTHKIQRPISNHNDQETIGTHNIHRPISNHNDQETIGTHSIQRPISNHNDQETIGTHNIQRPISNHNDQETIGTHNIQRPISNHNDQETAGTHSIQRPISNHNDQETIGTHNVQRPISNHNDQETIGTHNIHRPISNHNDQETVGTHNVQRPISNHNDQETIGTHNIHRPISNHNDQETIGTHSIQRPISNHNDQETIGTHNVKRPISNHNDQDTIELSVYGSAQTLHPFVDIDRDGICNAAYVHEMKAKGPQLPQDTESHCVKSKPVKGRQSFCFALLNAVKDFAKKSPEHRSTDPKSVWKTSFLGVLLFKQPLVVCFQVSMFFSTMATECLLQFYPASTKEFGMSDYQTAFLLSIVGIGDILSRLAMGLLGDCHLMARYKLVLVPQLILGSACFLSRFATSFWSQAVFALVIGLTFGVGYAFRGVLIFDFFGLTDLSRLIGISNMIGGFGLIAGGPLIGYIRDMTGDYKVAMLFLGASFYLGGLTLLVTGALKWYQGRKSQSYDTD